MGFHFASMAGEDGVCFAYSTLNHYAENLCSCGIAGLKLCFNRSGEMPLRLTQLPAKSGCKIMDMCVR